MQRRSSSLRYVNCCPGHIQSTYSSAYLGFNIQLKVPALLLEISRQFDALYTAKFVPNTAHILQYTLCELWSRHIQCIYSSEYSGFNNQLNVSALLLETSRLFNERYTASRVPKTAHIVQFSLSELCSRTYTM
jgi:hypothetical protein